MESRPENETKLNIKGDKAAAPIPETSPAATPEKVAPARPGTHILPDGPDRWGTAKAAPMAILLAALILMVLLPTLSYQVLGRYTDRENYENRILSERPSLTEGDITKFPGKYDAWFGDNLPYRNALLTANGWLDYHVFGSTLNRQVLIGEEGWLFYRGQQLNSEDSVADYYGTNLMSEEELAAYAETLVRARDTLAARGIEFVVMIPPNKERMMWEYMPARYGEPGEYTRLHQLADYLSAHTDLRLVLPEAALTDYKERYPDQRIYYKYDTHWNNLGAYIGARLLLEELGITGRALPEDLEKSYGEPPASYDLARLLHLGNALKADDPPVVLPTAVSHYMEREMNEDGTEFRFRIYDENVDPRKVFLIGDSFSTMMAPYVADGIKELYLNFYYNYEPAMMDREAPDVVVYEVVERYIESIPKFSIDEVPGEEESEWN